MFELVKAHRDGSYTIAFPEHLVELIAGLAGQLDGMLDDDRPELKRLFPTAYADDAERDAGYQILARGELVDQRRANVQQVLESAGEDRAGTIPRRNLQVDSRIQRPRPIPRIPVYHRPELLDAL